MEHTNQLVLTQLPHWSAGNSYATSAQSTVAYGLSNSAWQPADNRDVAADRDWVEFSLLVDGWKKETTISSSIKDAISSPYYRKIIDMGPEKAIPFIARQLEQEGSTPDHWWWALRELAGFDPVPPELNKDIRAVARYWIKWAHDRYAWELATD
jgi:hypothetical protein